MRAIVLLASALCAMQGPARVTHAGSAWEGTKVMPRLGAVAKVGNTTVDETMFGLPWTVQAASGKWLWVGNDHKGWVQRSQVVRLDDAPVYYTQCIARQQNAPSAYCLRGRAWMATGQLDKAIADFDEAIRLAPNNAVSYDGRGTAWSRKKDSDRALADYDEAIRLDPKYSAAYFDRANEWEDRGDVDQALEDYGLAAQFDPNLATAYCNRARIWYD